MGNCNSDESTAVATAKLVLLDGALQEFSSPVKVSHVLQKNPACFVCDADEMDFDDFVSAVDVEEELRPGQLYFALPLTWLGQPLQAADMASLAVKASLALGKCGGGGEEKCGCCWKGVGPVVFSEEKHVRSRRKVGGSGGCRGGGGLVEERRARRGGGGGKGRKFITKLSMIQED